MSGDIEPAIFTYAKFNLQALCQRASTLRQCGSCVCDPDERPVSGSFNWATFIKFEDGVRWVFRSPHARTFMPIEQGLKLLSSEAATLKYLKSHSDIPVPEVYDYWLRSPPESLYAILTSRSASSDNEIGVPFILMSEAPGWPLSKVWKPIGSPQQDMNLASKAKILTQLGNITGKLSQLRFKTIGSIFETKGSIEVRESLWRGHMLHERYVLDVARGPFASKAEFYDSIISAFREHAEMLRLSHHCFVAPVPSPEEYSSTAQYIGAVRLWNDFVTIGSKIDTAHNRLDYIIASDVLLDIIQSFDHSSVNDPETFPLCHADLSANNIYVDDDYNITCIIDWAFASSIPESLLLAAPGLPQYGNELSPDLRAFFFDGFIDSVSGSVDKSELMQRGEVSWKIGRLLNLDSINDYDLFASVWHFARGSSEDMGRYFVLQRRCPYYLELYKEVQEEDQPRSKIEKDEREHFQNKDLKKTIAKKLTFVSEWEQQYTTNHLSIRKNIFVATPQLWKWIQQCMEDWENESS